MFAQSNPELKALYDADQKDRDKWQSLTAAERQGMVPRDAARRKRVAEMLRAGALKTGEDYKWAAWIFQHGAEPADYLLAHVLAMTANAIQPPVDAWIVAATLDRYLRSTGKQEVFGLTLDPNARFD
ncbi:MAG TPA: hypothetical protein VE959_35285 [Bryobacteraceae bacterium]|nr:hypothetical protein [Bryobacteraceae bacterium]